MHWTDQQSTGGRTGRLPRPLVDPFSGQPGFKSTPLRIEPLVTEWTGFLVSAVEPSSIAADYATSSRVSGGWLVELAGSGDTAKLAESVLPQGERMEVNDAARGQTRIAVLADGRLKAALYLSRSGGLPARARDRKRTSQ